MRKFKSSFNEKIGEEGWPFKNIKSFRNICWKERKAEKMS